MTTPTYSSRIQQQDYKFQVSLPAGIWRWTTRVDVSLAMPRFEVRDVLSPYGTLADMVPIPGPVIAAMAESIVQLQASFAPSILLSASSMPFVLNQAQGVSSPQPITLTNNGVFGSLLAATITTSAPWLAVTPANVDGLAFGETGTFNVTADSTLLLATSSPYTGTITVQDPTASNNPQTIAVTITVLPVATIAVSPTALAFNVTAPLSPGQFSPVPPAQFMLSNSGPAGSQLTYLIQKLVGCSPWLSSFTPFMGNLASGQTQPITVSVAPLPCTPPGSYTETLRVSGYSTNFTQDVQVQLIIS